METQSFGKPMVNKYTSSGRKRTQEEIRESYFAQYRVRCKCGHTFLIVKGKKLCRYCGEYVYKNKQEEFKDKLRSALNG